MQSAQPMTPRERAAYDAGIRAAIHAAQIVAITIETAPDAHALPKRVAAEAMAAFAEGAKGLMLSARPPTALTAVRMIADDPAMSGTITCPECAGRMSWAKSSHNGHIHAQCEGACGTRLMQ